MSLEVRSRQSLRSASSCSSMIGRAALAAAQHDGRGSGQGVVTDAASRRRAARLSWLARVVGLRVRCDAVEKARRSSTLPAAGIARQRPAECQMHSRPCDPDVEQPSLLFDGLAVLAVCQRVRDGQGAVGEADEEDRIPFQTLGRVQRGQGDALHDGWVPGVGALPQLGEQPAQIERRPLRHFVIDELGECGQRLPPFSGPGSRRRFGGHPQRIEQLAHQRWQFVARRVGAAFGRTLHRQQRLPDLLTAEEPFPAAHLERDACLGQAPPRTPPTGR